MPDLPGTSDGQKIADKRRYHLPPIIQAYYRLNLGWDEITDCKTNGHGETVTVNLSGDRKHTWRRKEGKWHRFEDGSRESSGVAYGRLVWSVKAVGLPDELSAFLPILEGIGRIAKDASVDLHDRTIVVGRLKSLNEARVMINLLQRYTRQPVEMFEGAGART